MSNILFKIVGASIDERPAPAVQTDPSMKDNEIYKIPIVVIPGRNKEYLICDNDNDE